jgi:hypothetical protein
MKRRKRKQKKDKSNGTKKITEEVSLKVAKKEKR